MRSSILTPRISPRDDGEPGPWAKELDDFVRAFSGAFLFGMPLLYTQEMWSLGASIDTPRLIALVVVAFMVNLGLTFVSGFKQETTIRNHIDQATDAVAVGIVGSAVVLVTLNQISFNDPLDSVLGKLVVEAVPLSIGASVANAIFGRGDRSGSSSNGQEQSMFRSVLKDLGATAVGALFVSFSVAPTDEISSLAAGLGQAHLVALMVLSLLVSYIIVFASGFDPQKRNQQHLSVFQQPASETTLAYLVSLVVAFCGLALLQGIGPEDSLSFVIAQTLVLGLPASVGGAAGRVAL